MDNTLMSTLLLSVLCLVWDHQLLELISQDKKVWEARLIVGGVIVSGGYPHPGKTFCLFM